MTDITLYLTKNFINDANKILIVDCNFLIQLERQLFPLLKSYPAIGRLLLNRKVTNNEISRIGQQIITQLHVGEVREYCLNQYLVIYLLIDSSIFLLGCMELTENNQLIWEQF